MLFSIFLHFYQPHFQQKDILEKIVNESYRKILKILKNQPEAKLTINLNAGLLELLERSGYSDVIEDFKFLVSRNQIELTGTAAYHAFLPLLPEKEIERQILINRQISEKYFGKFYQPKGFFSPELAYDLKVATVAKKLGFQYILAEELASPFKQDFSKIYQIKGLKDFYIIFRNKRLSVLILSAILRNIHSLKEEIAEDFTRDCYLLTIMDGETFGHHRPGLENFLLEIFKDQTIRKAKVSEILEKFKTNEIIEPRACTWSSEEQDFWLEKEKGLVSQYPFILWFHPQNPIHHLQWEFTDFVIEEVEKNKNHPLYQKLREKLDQAISSDQYWWASAQPWWSLEMIEQGAYHLKEIVLALPSSSQVKERAEKYYQEILKIAFEWQRSGKIRETYRRFYQREEKRPFKERTPNDWYNLIILEFEDEMKKAIENLEFEKAIKWRDALYKLKEGTDIYDVLHVVDDLRMSRQLPSLKSFYEHSLDEFSSLVKNYFKAFSEEKFENEQMVYLKDSIKKAFFEKKFGPLGFSQDKEGNFYLCEYPSREIKFYLNDGWNSFSGACFPKEGIYGNKNQCQYEVRERKINIEIKDGSLIDFFLKLLKTIDKNRGGKLKVAILREQRKWRPEFFKKNKFIKIPYSQYFAFKFRISGFKL
ncbi:MAG: UvrB/UvrC motif-containing protein [Patescibacteria group bacterium]|nr:UvrB/UvrC motif-containing protein [Patescibacteria group bacterium]